MGDLMIVDSNLSKIFWSISSHLLWEEGEPAGRVATGDDSISSSFWIMSKRTGKDAFLSADLLYFHYLVELTFKY